MSTAPLINDTFLRACFRQATDYTPIWLMRQAGRYLPEYCATRAKAGSFMGLATHPDWATEVTLQPLERYPLDAAILFSDILTVPDAMGLGLSFAAGEGPKFEKSLRHECDIEGLCVPDMHRLQYVFDATASIRKALQGRVPLIGFSGSPWTLACYMVEGGSSADYRQIKLMTYSRPDLMHRILSVNADAVALYLNEQIKAGAQAVMIFDSWGGVLPAQTFESFSLAYTQRVLSQLISVFEGKKIPRIVFTKGGGAWLEKMASTLSCEVLAVDWTVDLQVAREKIGTTHAIQGNLDPMVLLTSSDKVIEHARSTLDRFGKPHQGAGLGPSHIFNLGHGIDQHTPPDHVAALVEYVHAYSRQCRQA